MMTTMTEDAAGAGTAAAGATTTTEGAPKRYLILAERYSGDAHYGKTARGLLRYRGDDVVAVLDSTRAGGEMEGKPVVASVDEALAHGPTTAVVGVATAGGRFPSAWRALLRDAIAAGLDVESGLHEFLTEDAELAGLAARHGVELRDLRRPPEGLSVPTGENLRVPAKIVATVGSDCAIGKKTVALELDLEARSRGIRSQFVPTGQTGILIAGWGIAVDAVVADFLAGAAERLVVEGHARGGEDLLVVEGQGSLVHPDYSGVTLGLLHGSAPHALVLCHVPGTTHIEDRPEHPIPPLPELIDLVERSTLPARRAAVAAIALNTRTLDDGDARSAIADAERETGLPADDPVRFGAAKLVGAIAP
jgi:uncharacterized NAD-dependent epimerase/dehydratase family protein